jgi:hypothetical protein
MPISLHPSQVGRNWRELNFGEPLTTLTQSYLPDQDVWVDATLLTKDGYTNRGRMNYRTPMSWTAKVSAFYTALPKLWRRYVLRRQW